MTQLEDGEEPNQSELIREFAVRICLKTRICMARSYKIDHSLRSEIPYVKRKKCKNMYEPLHEKGTPIMCIRRRMHMHTVWLFLIVHLQNTMWYIMKIYKKIHLQKLKIFR